MPIVSYFSSSWATSSLVPTPSVEIATPNSEEMATTFAKYPKGSNGCDLLNWKVFVTHFPNSRRPPSSRRVSTPTSRYVRDVIGCLGRLVLVIRFVLDMESVRGRRRSVVLPISAPMSPQPPASPPTSTILSFGTCPPAAFVFSDH